MPVYKEKGNIRRQGDGHKSISSFCESRVEDVRARPFRRRRRRFFNEKLCVLSRRQKRGHFTADNSSDEMMM